MIVHVRFMRNEQRGREPSVHVVEDRSAPQREDHEDE
jgi:hypothetical protein